MTHKETSGMNRAHKYRIYPTTEQKTLLLKTFGCCRKVWNLMLEDKEKYYAATGKILKPTPAGYKKDYPYLKEVDSLALANVQLQLEQAYKRFFEDSKVGAPKFKSRKKRKQSYTTNLVTGNIVLTENTIKLPKVGIVRAKIHRTAPDDWRIKSVTVSMDNCGDFYASVLFEYEANIVPISIDPERVIGLDYKSDGLYMDSNGNKPNGRHKYFRDSQDKLAKAQRILSRRHYGSENYKKQLKKVNKIARHIANQRKDFLHKLSTEIANQHDAVCVEDLDLKAISNSGFKNGKATMDNGYGMFINMLEYKLSDRGKQLIWIDKWYPSTQICSNCGTTHKMELKDRTYVCPKCGMVMDRDINAAINIRNEGLKMLKLPEAA